MFHKTVSSWFEKTFAAPTAAQTAAWQAIQSGQSTLIAAPTGAGKTLAAFLAAIDELITEGLQTPLADETRVLYISPLKALSNDVQKNLQLPLNGIRDELLLAGLPDVPVNAWVRTGDTSQAERSRMRRQPPHIMVTTPESLFILLTSESGREMLKTVRSVIVDEIHALAGNKRGAHLTLSLQRLDSLCRNHSHHTPKRIGLSATQKPIEAMAHFLMGNTESACEIIDCGHVRERDLKLVLPESPLEAVMANEVWDEMYNELTSLIEQHQTTLIFVNTRRLAERVAHHLAEKLGTDAVTAHHGSLSRKHRLQAEQQLKNGELRALVATASLELGIDIGDIDLVCQLGSPRAIATFLQRVGRSGHAIDAMPKGRLFPLSHNDLVECVALLDATSRDELDRIHIPHQPLDVLAQQVVAEVASQEWSATGLYETLKQAWPYRDLDKATFDSVVRMLAEGYSTRRGRRGAYLHRDIVNDKLRSRRGARLVALTNGGAIPDQFDYDVILQPEGTFIGSLNEDFAFESMPGDIFQLGNTSYRMLKIEQGRVFVEDAQGQPPNIPFWFGEAPGRSDELSHAVSTLLQSLDTKLASNANITEYLQQHFELEPHAAKELSDYATAARAALGHLPSQQTIIFERFFDEAGDMHLVIHSPYGSRINRAWGLALRKRFCRQFNFELQAAATDNTIVLSLGPTHSFQLDEVVNYLNKKTVRQVLTQALLDAPMFNTRWRWNANISLAVPRNRNGKRVPAQFQRSDAEDLVALVFPDQLACLENIQGDREIPDHPLVQQTLHDCLNDTMDIVGLEHLYQQIEQDKVHIVCRDLNGPSILCGEILTARPYAFLDDGAAEERRTQNVQQQRFAYPESAAELGQLNPDAVHRVREEAWPDVTNADELYDALVLLGFAAQNEIPTVWHALLTTLENASRITHVQINTDTMWYVSAERLHEVIISFPAATYDPAIAVIHTTADTDPDNALRTLIRSHFEGMGPVTLSQLAQTTGVDAQRLNNSLIQLEQEGFLLRGRYEADANEEQWCERRLLARIHRYTIQQRRKQIEPVSAQVYMRFLLVWQHVAEPLEGADSVFPLLEQLEGLTLPAISWERDILPARMTAYFPQYLDQLCNTGRIHWQRLNAENTKLRKQGNILRHTGISLLPRKHVHDWLAKPLHEDDALSAHARQVRQILAEHGASFFDEIHHATQLLPSQLETALAELVAAGWITSDNFAGLRALISPKRKSRFQQRARATQLSGNSFENAGRWSLLHKRGQPQESTQQVEHIARVLLKRYGVVFRKVIEKENNLPPWRELVYEYRRMEARGEIRGGRFVSGFSGEQFALPEAIAPLYRQRETLQVKTFLSISATDPLNLTGIITPGERIPAKHTIRILYRDGIPVGYSQRGKVHFLEELEKDLVWEAQNIMLRQQQPARYQQLVNSSRH